MYFDGSLRLQGVGTGILFIAPRGDHLKYAIQLLFLASNNTAEYEALIHGLNIVVSLGIKRLMLYGDSLVVISQVNKYWDCSMGSMSVTPGFKGQSRVHLIYAPKKTTHTITKCIEIHVTISSEYLLHSGSLTK
jgi:ribonuclease HI